jgi:hypothetical protein
MSSWWTSASALPVTRDALVSTFDSDIRNLVYRWDPDDPRPQHERHAALFSFVHQTYETSAWIPQSLFDGNLVTQVVVGDVDTIVRDRVGTCAATEIDGDPHHQREHSDLACQEHGVWKQTGLPLFHGREPSR